MESTQWYKISLYAKMSDEYIRTIDGWLFETVEEKVGVGNCCDLDVEDADLYVDTRRLDYGSEQIV